MRICAAIEARSQRERGKVVSHVFAAAQVHDEYGGILIVATAIAYHAAQAVYYYVKDVRYYRARKLVRDREAIR